jgi:hypothetical protein
MENLIKLVGKEVIIDADGILYKGELVEVSETEAYLRLETGWITIPMEKISSITAA